MKITSIIPALFLSSCLADTIPLLDPSKGPYDIIESEHCYALGAVIPDNRRMYKWIDQACSRIAGEFNGLGGNYDPVTTKTACWQVHHGHRGKLLWMEIYYDDLFQAQDITLERCGRGLRRVVDHCEFGGDAQEGNWWFRVDANHGGCGSWKPPPHVGPDRSMAVIDLADNYTATAVDADEGRGSFSRRREQQSYAEGVDP